MPPTALCKVHFINIGQATAKTLMIMKLTVILLTAFCLQVSARGYTQGITLSEKEATLKKVINEISKQSGYNVFYNQDALLQSKKVTIDVINISLKDALELCFKDQPLTYTITGKTIIVKLKEEPTTKEEINIIPPIDVKGKITNELDEPVAGASVRIKGTNKGTSTNENGEFTLTDIDANATLVISGTNIETIEWKVSGKTELSITAKIKIAEGADVTINTGYQKLSPNKATGSYVVVTNEELNRRVGSDILSRLEGVTSGMVFDRRSLNSDKTGIDASNIIIRGLSTLSPNIKAPLIVIDNFPYDGDVNNINPNDVENITVLKDAAAASIWGAKAGNGVIVITTKKGLYNQPLRFSVNVNTTIFEKPDLFHYPRMSVSDFIDVEKFLFVKGFYDADINNQINYPALTPVIEILVKQRNGLISPAEANSQIDILGKQDVRNDYKKYFYRSQVLQQYSMNFSGGGPKLNYYLSGGIDKNLADLVDNENHRITLISKNSFTPLKNLEIQFGLQFAQTTQEINNPFVIDHYEYRPNKNLYPYAQLADANGNHLAIPKDYRSGYTDTAGGGKLLDWKYRPLDELRLGNNKSQLQDVLINVGTKYKFTNYLSAELSYKYESSKQKVRNLSNQQTYFARNFINLFTQIQGNSITYYVQPGGILDLSYSELKSKAVRGQINFNKDWGENNLIAIGGSEISESNTVSNTYRTYGYNENNLSSASVDNSTLYPLYGGLGLGFIPNNTLFGDQLNRIVSLYGNAVYTYKRRYTTTVSLRRDGSNLFGVKANDKWKPFWSIGGAWDISKESFYKFAKVIPSLKIRASYGYSGNVNNGIPTLPTLTYSPASNSIINQPIAVINKPGNPNLSWESIRMLNVQLDFSTKNNRISGVLEWYQKRSKNLIYNQTIDPTTGLARVSANSAYMQGNGIDISLTSININKKFKWQSNLIFNYSSMIVTKVLNDYSKFQAIGFVGGGLNIVAITDRNPYGVYSYRWGGLDPSNGDPQGYLNGQLSKNYFQIVYNNNNPLNDLVYHGPGLPPYSGYLSNSFSFKGIIITARLSYGFAYYFRKNTISYYNLYFFSTSHPDFAKRWQNVGDESKTNVPSMVYPVSNSDRDDFYAFSEINVLRGDNIRFQDIRISYDLGKNQVKKLFFNHAQVYGYINNLGILWRANKEGLDPDYNTGNEPYPTQKSFALGLKIDF
jgi:TonB-linked SusC/RagA family outer membrane protein